MLKNRTENVGLVRPAKFKYTVPDDSDNDSAEKAKEKERTEKQAKEDEQEVGAYKWPRDMYVSSRLILSEKNLEATDEYLRKASNFHHLWQPDEEIGDIKKAILMHKDAKARQEKKKEQAEQLRKIKE